MDVRRAAAAAGAAGLVLVGGPAWAQEDPCAPGPDGSVPEMCQSQPVSDTDTVDMEPEPQPVPEQTCPPQPVEDGDGTVTDAPQDGGEPDEGVAPGEPAPGTDPAGDARPAGEPAEEPAEDLAADSGPVVGDPTLVCAFAVPISAPVDDTAGGGATEGAAVADGAVLPRTGPERVLALTAVGAGLVVAGAAAVRTGRRRTAGA